MNSKRSDWLGLVLVTLGWLWIMAVSFSAQFSAWALPAVWNELSPDPVPHRALFSVAASALQAIAIALPLMPFALWWRTPRYRSVFRTWLIAAVVLLALTPTRLIPVTQPLLVMLAQFLLALGVAVVARRLEFRRVSLPTQSGQFLALALGGLLAVAWLAWGSLGSPLDALSGLSLAVAFAFVCANLLDRHWLRQVAREPRGPGWDALLGGFVASAMLAITVSGLGPHNFGSVLLLAVPWTGWLVSALNINSGQPTRNVRAIAIIIALAAAGPLLLVDSDALLFEFIISPGEMIWWALRAAGLTALLALAFGLALLVLSRRPAASAQNRLQAIFAASVWLGALAIYLFYGQPGFYGDQLLVIFKDQADVSAARTMLDYDARRAWVYQTLVDRANVAQAGLTSTLDQLGIRYTRYYLVNAIQVEADSPFTLWFSLMPEVDRVLSSPILRPLPEPLPVALGRASQETVPGWNLVQVGTTRVWNELGVTGEGIVIGQSDSGVQGDHPELQATYRGRDGQGDYSWHDPWYHTPQPTDIGGHGTHTLGTVVGQSVGVAPGAEWIGCANLARNLGNPGYYLDCLQFMLAPFPMNGDPLEDGEPTRSAMVLNNSWGCPPIEGCDADTLLEAARALRAAGLFVVASAGNDGPACGTVDSPLALYSQVWSVGAVNSSGRMASFSSRGPVTADGSARVKPDQAAPGVNILSAYPQSSYIYLSGTSMASPHVAGVVALMWSANPRLIGNIERTEQILAETSAPIPLPDTPTCGDVEVEPNNLVGYGAVDAFAAVERALQEK